MSNNLEPKCSCSNALMIQFIQIVTFIVFCKIFFKLIHFRIGPRHKTLCWKRRTIYTAVIWCMNVYLYLSYYRQMEGRDINRMVFKRSVYLLRTFKNMSKCKTLEIDTLRIKMPKMTLKKSVWVLFPLGFYYRCWTRNLINKSKMIFLF